MFVRRSIPLGLAGCVLAGAVPVLAHPHPSADPAAAPDEPTIVFHREEVAQSLPGDAAPQQPSHADAPAEDTQPVEAVIAAPELAYDAPTGHADRHEHGRHVHHAPHAPIAHALPPHPYPVPHQPVLEHEQWLAECRDRLHRVGRRDDGRVGGGIIGGLLGGVIGNRVARGDRLAGTIIGAGVGGLAGVAVGSAIDAAARERDHDRAADECELYLEDYLARYAPYAGQALGYAHGYPVQMTYVPVLVMVPQRAVVRETVTEEWVDVAAPARRTIHRRDTPAPTPANRTKRVKGN